MCVCAHICVYAYISVDMNARILVCVRMQNCSLGKMGCGVG